MVDIDSVPGLQSEQKRNIREMVIKRKKISKRKKLKIRKKLTITLRVLKP
jgi:hypothetical protein